MADTFALLDPLWVSMHVIEPRLHQFVDPRVPYLIGRLGMAVEGSPQRDYLEQCLVQDIPAVQARALRALGALRADAKRLLCESVVAADWAEVRRQGVNLPPEIAEEDRNRLQNAAMESLREIGNVESIAAAAGRAPAAIGMTITLRQLSFDVAEEIYWQVTGGLSGKRSIRPARPANTERRA